MTESGPGVARDRHHDDRHRSRPLCGVALVAAVLAVAGCSGSAGGDVPDPSRADTGNDLTVSATSPGAANSPSVSSGSFVPPVAGSPETPELALRPSAQEEAALTVAVEAAIAVCMSDHGFQYQYLDTATFLDGIDRRNAATSLSFPLGDLNEAPESIGVPEQVADPNAEYLASLDTTARSAYETALGGSGKATTRITTLDGGVIEFPSDGCRSDAYTTVYDGDLAEVQSGLVIVANLAEQIHVSTLTDPTVIGAQARWSECLAHSGYRYHTFAEAREARITAPDPQAAELLRGADRTCALDSGLTSSYRAVFNRNFSAEYERNRELIDRFTNLRAEAIKRL